LADNGNHSLHDNKDQIKKQFTKAEQLRKWGAGKTVIRHENASLFPWRMTDIVTRSD